MNRRVRWLVALAILSGCGPSQQGTPLGRDQMEEVRLRDVAELYRMHQASAQKPPRSLKDFTRLGDADAPTGYTAIQSGQVVVRWEATLPDTEVEPTSSPTDEVLAYVSTVPEKGGLVLTLDRRIRQMTAEEFRSAKLAGTAGEAAKKARGRAGQ